MGFPSVGMQASYVTWFVMQELVMRSPHRVTASSGMGCDLHARTPPKSDRSAERSSSGACSLTILQAAYCQVVALPKPDSADPAAICALPPSSASRIGPPKLLDQVREATRIQLLESQQEGPDTGCGIRVFAQPAA